MKNMKLWLSIVMILLYSAAANAYDFEERGIYYYITSEANRTVGVCFNQFNDYSGEVVLPTSVVHNGITYSVTSIAAMAFYNCSNITSITIPNSVTDIVATAFKNCI